MALRLSKLFGSSPEFWLNAQRAVDLWIAERESKQEIEKMEFTTVRCGASKRNCVEAAPGFALKKLKYNSRFFS
jgi:plasmid maintenance system antidote protein VapI